jgi:Spy/CpxP family protein refolding chaperone
MKKWILILVANLALTSFLSAQAEEQLQDKPRLNSEEKVEKRLKKMAEYLELSAEQEAQVRALMLKAEEKRREAQKALRETGQEMRAAIKEILDKEQMEKLKAMRREIEKKRSKPKRQDQDEDW